jgi:hypothetical protein
MDCEVLIGLAPAETRLAAGHPATARAALADAAGLLARADRLYEPARTRFLAVPDDARCLAMAGAAGVLPA